MELGSQAEQIRYHREVKDAQADVEKNRIFEAINALTYMRKFMSASQISAVGEFMRGEERKFFIDTMIELKKRIQDMPKVYEQDGAGKDAVIYLHYFINGCDFWITEKDLEVVQNQAFGVSDIGNGPEFGYISIVELIRHNAELDFHYIPKTIKEQCPNL